MDKRVITPKLEKYNFEPYRSILNLCKSKSFPEDFYFVYQLDKKEIGDYLNTWFLSKYVLGKKVFLITDTFFTVKNVDEDTSYNLYQKLINPIEISIQCPIGARFTTNENGDKLYQMMAQICSIDDSAFRIWFHKDTLENFHDIRLQLMKWVNKQDLVNGEEFIFKCVEIGGDPETIDYN